MPKNPNIRKVLVIGSGPIVIGQAAEFDYAGAQACRVLREEGVRTVLVNSNPATIMTDKHLADAIYLEPLTAETLRRIIALERPDGLLAGLGGQTGLTLAMQLTKDGTLEKYGVKLLGSGIDAIERAEDRERFRETLAEMGQPIIPSATAEDVETALAIAERIGYPVIVRPAYTLGGTGGGIAANADELGQIARQGLDLSPITQVLVEKCVSGWKEIEFETMRDCAGNVIAVCSMENVDPVGIHTGDSIVVAPALTLADREYQMLRSAARGRLQRAVCHRPGQLRLRRHRGQSPRLALVRPGLEGDRLPHRQDVRAHCPRLHPRRDQKRHHGQDLRLLRAGARLCGGEVPEVAV